MSSSLAAGPLAEGDAGFATMLRDHTKLVHRDAERAGFIADLLRGQASKAGYALYLRNLHPVYAALETALANWADHPLAGPFADRRLHRAEALSSDLDALSGGEWVTLPVLAEATVYAEAITGAAQNPTCLTAHAYARYLGDLSGGQILKPFLTRTLGLEPDALGFYDFPAFADIAVPKRALRAALDTVSSQSDIAQVLCNEAVTAFRHNIALAESVRAALL